MLAPSSLSELLGCPVDSVEVTPLASNGWSASELPYVQAGDLRLVLKRLSTDDWLTRASRDDRYRSMAVWRTGGRPSHAAASRAQSGPVMSWPVASS
jgi:hypothetical protein